jgi:hypothetical protein
MLQRSFDKTCLTLLKGQYQGKEKNAGIGLEAVVDHNLLSDCPHLNRIPRMAVKTTGATGEGPSCTPCSKKTSDKAHQCTISQVNLETSLLLSLHLEVINESTCRNPMTQHLLGTLGFNTGANNHFSIPAIQ